MAVCVDIVYMYVCMYVCIGMSVYSSIKRIAKQVW